MIPIVKPFILRYNFFVRLDLFLKAARLIRRRTLARQMCENGLVVVNGNEAKPSKEVKQGDTVTVRFSSRIIELEIIGMLTSSSLKIPPEELYRIKSQIRIQKTQEQWNENL